MTILRTIAEAIGWALIAGWLLGALGLADFVLSFGPAKGAP